MARSFILSGIRPLLVAGSLASAAISGGVQAAEPLRGVVDAPTLAARLGDKNLVVLDIRSGDTRELGRNLFRAGHIPGAVHADYAFASWRLPREKISVYLPEPAQFEALAGDLGIAPESDVVVVHEGSDASSFGAAARVYWSFKAMGHVSVAVLDGGYRGWQADKTRKIETGEATPAATIYEASPVPALRASLDEVLGAEKTGALLVDSRPASFFVGLEKHKAVAAFGHIPGAVNIPHSRAFTPDFRLKDKASLAREYAVATKADAAIVYCNTGHWGATDWFVLSEILGQKGAKLYDGSMLEYTLERKGRIVNPRGRSGS